MLPGIHSQTRCGVLGEWDGFEDKKSCAEHVAAADLGFLSLFRLGTALWKCFLTGLRGAAT